MFQCRLTKGGPFRQCQVGLGDGLGESGTPGGMQVQRDVSGRRTRLGEWIGRKGVPCCLLSKLRVDLLETWDLFDAEFESGRVPRELGLDALDKFVQSVFSGQKEVTRRLL